MDSERREEKGREGRGREKRKGKTEKGKGKRKGKVKEEGTAFTVLKDFS